MELVNARLSRMFLWLNYSIDADVLNQPASGNSCSGCHANPDAFIRQLCFDSFHARHPASTSFDDVISGGCGSGTGELGAGLERRDANQLQRLPLVDRQLVVPSNVPRDQIEWRHSPLYSDFRLVLFEFGQTTLSVRHFRIFQGQVLPYLFRATVNKL